LPPLAARWAFTIVLSIRYGLSRDFDVDLSDQMIFRNRVAKTKLVKTVDLGHSSDGPSWIDLTENRVTQRNHGSRHLSIDFCNKICQQQTLTLATKPQPANLLPRLRNRRLPNDNMARTLHAA
jgi:hypothetical protein